MFAYGAQYYRPPNPPETAWADDIRQMSKLGFNTVKLWAMWNHVHVAPDEFDFSELDELVALAGDEGLDVVVSLILENAPHWLAEQYPEARYEDQDGQKVDLRARPNTPGGGWPGLCLNNDPVRDHAERFTKRLASHYDDNPTVVTYTTWDEAFFEPNLHFPDKRFCYCEACTDAFRDWLGDRYGSVDDLNEVWETRYTDWSQISPPSYHGGYPRFLDWLRFRLDSHQHHMGWRSDVLDDNDRTASVRAHGISGNLGDLPYRFNDDWRSAQTVDEWGTTTFPHWGPDHPEITTDPTSQAISHLLMLDVARGASDGKAFWQTELQGGHVRSGNSIDPRGLTRGPDPDPESMRLWNWNALAGGVTGILYWQYRPELLGHESPGFGLVQRDGSITNRTEVARTFANLVNENPILEESSPVKGDVAIGTITEGPIFNYVAEKNVEQFSSSIRGIYKALWNTDFQVDFAKPHQFEGYDTVYLPFPLLLKQDTAEKIKQYILKGGSLITGGAPAVYAENGRTFMEAPGYDLDEVFGVNLITTKYADGEKLKIDMNSKGIVADSGSVDHVIPAAARRDIFEATSANVIGRWENGDIGATRNEFGEGSATALGTLPGGTVMDGDTTSYVRPMLSDLLEYNGASPRVTTSVPSVQTRVHTITDDKELLYVLNPSQNRITTEIQGRDITPIEKTIGDIAIVDSSPLRIEMNGRTGGALRM